MPIKVQYKNKQNEFCTIRPTPLCSIDTNVLKTGGGESFGVTYTITLTGTLLADQGTPYAFRQPNVPNSHGSSALNPDSSDVFAVKYPFNPGPPVVDDVNESAITFNGPYEAFDRSTRHILNESLERPHKQFVPPENILNAILSKQMALKGLFARDGQRLEISDWDNDVPSIVCYPRVIDISFQEGVYVDRCDYVITLEADTLLDDRWQMEEIASLYTGYNPVSGERNQEYYLDKITNSGINESTLVKALNGAFISDFSESWSIEVDDSQPESIDPFLPKTYRVTHSLSATGKTHYRPVSETGVQTTDAWVEAKNFVQNRLVKDLNAHSLIEDKNYGAGKSSYPHDNLSGVYPNYPGLMGKGIFNLTSQYKGYNHSRTEQIDKSAGAYSCTETFLLASGSSYESYSLNVNSDLNNPFITVSMQGNIKGLSELSPSGLNPRYDESLGEVVVNPLSQKTAYNNAIQKYNQVSNSGKFGVGSDLFKRANNAVAVSLNSQPNSVALGINEFTGDITYNLSFDNRPTNIISGVLTENIQVNDTYPGDVFATIPVLGRSAGPVLQYMGTRTEYKRDLNINFQVDYTKIPYGKERNPLLMKKPSVVQPMAQQLHELIIEMSPANEYGVRKYFVSPPVEQWNPKTGTYDIQISWTYELDAASCLE